MTHGVDWTAERKMFKAVTETTQLIAWATDQNGLCYYLSPQWYTFTGQKDDQGTGFNWLTAVHSADVTKVRQGFFEASDNRTAFGMSFRLRHAGGNYWPVWDVGLPKISDTGEFTGFFGTTCIIDYAPPIEAPVKSAEPQKPLLTEREREIVNLISHGNTTDTVASILRITTRTVDTHVSNAGVKLGAYNRAHIVATALRVNAI